MDVAQLRLGPYFTFGNFGWSNTDFMGTNAVLNYSSYHGVGSKGDGNRFSPVYESGKGFVVNPRFSGEYNFYGIEWGGDTSDKSFPDDFTHIMTLKYNGNVGIGTTTPDKKLTVNGTIHAKEVLVDLNVPGPDYVFEPDYQLRDLDELQQFIETNKHLPEVPSAATMEEEGISVSEMNMLLLKKVEELTLYILQQEKRIEKLENKN